MKKQNFDNWSKEELIKEVKALKKKKTYGLVWEEDKTKEIFDYYINWDGEGTKETFGEEEGKFPVLKEVKNKSIDNKDPKYNIMIEGDNYHALAVLNFTHNKAIDVIYIDPPYNRGGDFKYNDKIVDKEDGYRHSKWLSFMSKRLKLAKELLKDKGVIFISIDDTELAQLKILCDEIFRENFVALFPRSVGTVPKTTEGIQIRHDYVLCYAKENSFAVDINIAEEHFKFDDNDRRGAYALIHPLDSGTIHYSKSLDYPIKLKGKKYEPGQHIKNKPNGKWLWRWSEDLVKWGFENNLIVEKNNRLYTKNYRNLKFEKVNGKYELVKKEVGKPFTSDTLMSESFGNRVATRELKDILPNSTFTYPKPSNLIKKLITMTKNNKSAIILDFFAGSGTTGHAVMDLNKDDGGKRKFILCTNNENKISEEVCYPRLKNSINGINGKGKTDKKLNENLKYFKTDFVDSVPTDQNKKKIVDKSTEMLCIKENAFKSVIDKKGYKVFQNSDIHLGIIFNDEQIDKFVKEAKNIKGKFHVYVFSFDDSVPKEEFKSMEGRIKLCPIPEVILHVYRKIFK